MENTTTIIRTNNNFITLDQLNAIKGICDSVLNDEYEYEKSIIDQDLQMSATTKIKAYRQTAIFYLCCSFFGYAAYTVIKNYAV